MVKANKNRLLSSSIARQLEQFKKDEESPLIEDRESDYRLTRKQKCNAKPVYYFCSVFIAISFFASKFYITE